MQVKEVVDDNTVRFVEGEDAEENQRTEVRRERCTYHRTPPLFNPEQHILLADAKLIKRDAQVGDELVFPLETKDDYGRIAAQTAKQVIIQKIREAEKVSVVAEFGKRQGEIVSAPCSAWSAAIFISTSAAQQVSSPTKSRSLASATAKASASAHSSTK
jgi:hypothetical protein